MTFVADTFNNGAALWLRWLNTSHTLYIVKLLLATRLWADAFYEICGLSAGRRFTKNFSAIKRAGQAFTGPHLAQPGCITPTTFTRMPFTIIRYAIAAKTISDANSDQEGSVVSTKPLYIGLNAAPSQPSDWTEK